MPDDVLEEYIKSYIASQETPEITFAWQGGEPTLLGVDYFRKIIALEQQYADGKVIHNALQTNGTLLDDAWCELFKEHGFLVGLSVDGPEDCHDHYRVNKGGRPTFKQVMKGMEFLQKHEVEFNTLTCVQRHNSTKPLEVYKFLRDAGSTYLQFIPIVERLSQEATPEGLTMLTPDIDLDATVTPWSVRPNEFGIFLSTVFDEWVRRDVGRTFVQIFDVALQAWCGMEPYLCVFRKTCGDAMAMEHNGDLYSCDHFVYPEHMLGNIMDETLGKLVESEQQKIFGQNKLDTLPDYCRECPVNFVCNGECPKHRFINTPSGDPGLNYLCKGYKHFFTHIAPYMQFMAQQLSQQRPPANVMSWTLQQDMRAAGKTEPGPNDLCLCGSGRKFKKCCGHR